MATHLNKSSPVNFWFRPFALAMLVGHVNATPVSVPAARCTLYNRLYNQLLPVDDVSYVDAAI